jgi:hypothetical protein
MVAVYERVLELDVRTEKKHRPPVGWGSPAESSRFFQNSSACLLEWVDFSAYLELNLALML